MSHTCVAPDSAPTQSCRRGFWRQGEKTGGGTEVRRGQAGLEREKGSIGHITEAESPGLGDQVVLSKV